LIIDLASNLIFFLLSKRIHYSLVLQLVPMQLLLPLTLLRLNELTYESARSTKRIEVGCFWPLEGVVVVAALPFPLPL